MSENLDKGSIAETKIIDISHEGKGVGKIDGLTVFIEGGTLGDTVKLEITQMKKSFALAKTLEIIKPSRYRVASNCKVSDQCGGCQLRELDYERQLKMKTDKVKNDLERLGKLENVKVHDIIGMDKPIRYRNKAQIPVGEKHIGFYKKGSNSIVDTDECVIQSKSTEKVIKLVREFMKKYDVSGYSKRTNKGVIRHIVTKISFKTGDMMLILVTNSHKLPHKEEFIEMIRKEMPSVKSIIQNVNDKRTNLVLGERNKIIYGHGKIIDYIGDLQFKISPNSFFQVNPKQTQLLYEKALKFANLKGNETVFDIYSGIGSLSLFLSKKAKKVYGIEVVKEAVEDAKENAELNGITNVEFYEGTAESVLNELCEEGQLADVVVLDPPRKGCEQEVLESIVKLNPERIVYVSCNPSTLARDLSFLSENGFKVKEVQPVDMFPGSVHVETVTLIVKEN